MLHAFHTPSHASSIRFSQSLGSYHGGNSERESERVTALLPVETSSSHVAKAINRKMVSWSQHTTVPKLLETQFAYLLDGNGIPCIMCCSGVLCSSMGWLVRCGLKCGPRRVVGITLTKTESLQVERGPREWVSHLDGEPGEGKDSWTRVFTGGSGWGYTSNQCEGISLVHLNVTRSQSLWVEGGRGICGRGPAYHTGAPDYLGWCSQPVCGDAETGSGKIGSFKIYSTPCKTWTPFCFKS